MGDLQSGKPSTGSAVAMGSVRNALIASTLFVAAAIVFGVLYLFVIAPSIPTGNVGWFLFSFATGLTMIIMPCTLPLAFVIVPLSMGKGIVKGLGMALAFGLGVAFTLSLYGVAAALLGGVAIDALGTDLEILKNWVYFIAGSFALVFALSEIGLLNFHMPTYTGAAPAFIQKRQEIIKAFLLGVFLGNVGVGCPHPATPLILIEIATSGDVLYGWLMFLVHAIGRVLPLLLLAFLAILGVNGLNWLMARKDALERVTGWAMVFVAGFILTLGLFSHDWWVNSGIHSALETLTQESRFNSLINDTLGTNVAHLHELEEGEGLFGLPLGLGSWFLVTVWIVPMWWWWAKRRSKMYKSPAFRLRAIEAKLDRLEKDRRQIESMVDMDELEKNFDLTSATLQYDQLEEARRKAEEEVSYGESGTFKDATARDYEAKILKMQKNYLIPISILLILVFAYFMPKNFYYKSISGVGHGDGHGTAGEHAHGDASGGHAHDSSGLSLDGLHSMPDGSIHNGAGQMIPGAHLMPDGSVMLADGTTVTGDGSRLPLNGTIFEKSISGLPQAQAPELVTLSDGDTYNITASYVQKEIGNRTLRMLAYNQSVPGPFIKVDQDAEVTINFTNNTDLDQTIHSHGLRLDNNFDGVPYVTQNPVKPGETYAYTIKFVDAGVYWYHPHTRDDLGQEMGLYGNYLVDPTSDEYWSEVNREVPLVIDDILIENNEIVDFYKEFTNFALLGRFGNEFLVNGESDFTMNAQKGEVIRLFVTNVSNARPYNFSLPGAKLKLVGADIGRYEREEYINSFIISPAERVVVEAYFENAGVYKLLNTIGRTSHEMMRVIVSDEDVSESFLSSFNSARQIQEVVDEFKDFRSYLNVQPNKRLLLTVDLSKAPAVDHSTHGHGADSMGTGMGQGMMMGGVQWEDVGATDYTNTSESVWWQLIDQDTGEISMDIPVTDWTFKQGELVKIRLTNDMHASHVMQHPIHFHGQQFVVLSQNGVPNNNMAWKDTVLVNPGEVVDILVDMSNSGEWMSHCHISEHLHAGMMMQFRVENQDGYAVGDEYRASLPPELQHSSHSTNAVQQNIELTAFSYGQTIDSMGYHVVPESKFYRAESKTQFTISIFDLNNTGIQTSSTHSQPLRVTFVHSNNATKVTTYPGSTEFDTYVAPHGGAGHDNSDGHHNTAPASDGHEHLHMNQSESSFTLIPQARAHGGIQDGHPDATGSVFAYTMPVVFSEKGNYTAFVEFVPEGSNEVIVATFDVEVGSSGFSVDNYGWSKSQKWWILLIISLALMVPLVIGVRRYIDKKNV